jgi:hypothetical protein
MLTREKHARIYQGELSAKEYSELKKSAKQENLSVRELTLDAIRESLLSKINLDCVLSH